MPLDHSRRSASAVLCGRCPALHTGKLRHELRHQPRPVHPRRALHQQVAHQRRPHRRRLVQTSRRLSRRSRTLQRCSPPGQPDGADRDRRRQDQPGQSSDLGLAGSPAQRGAGENGIRRVADSNKRRNRRQSQTEGAGHRHGDEASRHGNGGAVLDADPELPGELTPTPAGGPGRIDGPAKDALSTLLSGRRDEPGMNTAARRTRLDPRRARRGQSAPRAVLW